MSRRYCKICKGYVPSSYYVCDGCFTGINYQGYITSIDVLFSIYSALTLKPRPLYDLGDYMERMWTYYA